MESKYYAYLIKVTSSEKCKRKKINAHEFKIGRSKEANLCLTDVSVSRNHCVILSGNDEWSLKNESQFGTIVSGRSLAVNEACQLKDGDVIQLGQKIEFTYKFYIRLIQDDLALKRARIEGFESEDSSHPPDTYDSCTVNQNIVREETQLKKENEELSSQLLKVIQEKEEVRNQYEDEKKRIETELQCEKNALEERLKAMEDLLSSKEREQLELNEKLKQIDEENKKLELLRQEQAITAEKIISELKNEVLQKELSMRETLEKEMESLLDSRKQIEESIRLEKEQTEGACAEKLKTLEDELSRVKCDLTNAEGKRCLLEKELEEAEKAKLKETESSLKAKREALAEFSNLIEMELQCSICNELFIKATTLNCTHTACHYCLQEWKKKKNLCPMCRAPIMTENHSIVLDSFIDKIVENLSEEMKQRRLEMIEERKGNFGGYSMQYCLPCAFFQDLNPAQVLLASQQQKNKGKRKKTRILIPVGPPAGIDRNIVVAPQPTTSQGTTANAQAADVIFLGAGEDIYTLTVGNQPGSTNHYGGYGACFICGRRGHWAGGCPARRSAT